MRKLFLFLTTLFITLTVNSQIATRLGGMNMGIVSNVTGTYMYADPTGGFNNMRRDSLKNISIYPFQLVSSVPANKGGTGLSGVGTNGQLLGSDGTNFLMITPNWLVTETDPIWNADKVNYLQKVDSNLYTSRFYLSSNYFSKVQSDIRYLQSFTEVDPTVPSHVKSITTTNITTWNTVAVKLDANDTLSLSNRINSKQATLVSGTNIKTLESQSLLGSGNIDLTKSDVGLSNVDNTSDLNKPISTAAQTALNGKESSITAGTTAQYWRGDKTWQTLDKNSFGLSNVDNTSDVNKPISTATQTALNSKQNALTAGSGISIVGNTISATGTAPGTNNVTGYSSGTVYSLTQTSAKIDFGTTDPSITLPSAGTYLILSNIKIEYAGLITALNSCSFKIRRTNNTPADIPNSTATFNVPLITLTGLTGTAGDADMPAIIYTTTNNNDVLELWGNRQNGLTIIGNINIGEASIVAIRIF